MPDVWRVELLGGLRAARGDRVVTRFDTRKAAALLALLALNPHRLHSREALAEQLWPDEDPDATRNRFKQVLSLLRKELEPPGTEAGSVLATDRTHVRLQPGALVSDVEEFEGALDAARSAGDPVSSLQAAARLYKGELLPGYYEEWILSERQRLAERHLGALENLAQALAERGDFAQALDHARRAVSADPLREASHALVMRVYAASGRVSEAVREYAELERTLREHLDSAPSASVRALLEQIRAQETKPAPPPLIQSVAAPPRRTEEPAAVPQPAPPPPPSRPQLPAPLTRFFGREEELARLTRMLAPHATRLVTLMGPAGAGKSRLSIEAARKLREDYGGHVWFVPLAAKTDVRSVLDAVTEALGLPVSEDADLLERIAGYLNGLGPEGGGPALLVLDNFEHLLGAAGGDSDAAGLLRALLERVPALSCVVSSRQRVLVEGERVFPVLPLSTPSEGEKPDLERLRALSSVRLFVDRAQAAEPFFELTEENGAAVAELCRQLEGIPLAIELAAAWSAELTPVQILSRLSRRFELLVSRRRDLDSRHQSLRAALEWSYRQLSPALKRFYSGLSVFRGGCTLEAAEAIAAGFARHGVADDPGTALEMLSELRGRSMVEVERGGDVTRYRLLETLREHAWEELGDAAEQASLCRLHASFFLSLAEEAEQELDGPDQARWLAAVEAEHDNLRAALRWAHSGGEPEVLGRLAAAMGEFWERRGYFHEGSEWLERALAAPDLVGAVRAAVLRGAGVLAWYRRDLPQAWSRLDEALGLYREAGDDGNTAITLVRLGNVALSQGRTGEAEALYWDAMNLFRSLAEPAKTAWALRCLGHAKSIGADYEPAMGFFEQSLEICRSLGELRGIAASLTYIGGVTRAMGDLERAAAATDEALEIHRKLGDRAASASALDCLALIAAGNARWERAHQLATESLHLYREIGSPNGITWLFELMGHTLSELGRMQRATLVWGAAVKADALHPRVTEERLLKDANVDLTRSMLGEAAFATAFAQGKQLTPERAINVVFLGEPL